MQADASGRGLLYLLGLGLALSNRISHPMERISKALEPLATLNLVTCVYSFAVSSITTSQLPLGIFPSAVLVKELVPGTGSAAGGNGLENSPGVSAR